MGTKFGGGWTLRTLYKYFSSLRKADLERAKGLRAADDRRYQQRFEADEEARKKVNEIRDIVVGINDKTMPRTEIEGRLSAIDGRINSETDLLSQKIEGHYSANGIRIKEIEDYISRERGKSEDVEKSRAFSMEVVTVICTIIIAGTALVGVLLLKAK